MEYLIHVMQQYSTWLQTEPMNQYNFDWLYAYHFNAVIPLSIILAVSMSW